jgi:putative flippase GtrA
MQEEISLATEEVYSDQAIYLEENMEVPQNEMEEEKEISRTKKFLNFMSKFCEKIEFIRFGMSGSIGTIIFYVFYELLYRANPIETNKATITWAVSYFISIIWQHALHRYLVFGWKGTSYFKTLFWTYISYSLSIIMSPIIIFILVDKLGIDYRIGWVVSLCATGLFNYVTLSMANQKDGERERDLVEVMNYRLGYLMQKKRENELKSEVVIEFKSQ